MLLRLLRTYLLRYRGLLLVVVALTLVQTMATLFLPSLNADIIDKGVATGDTAYIWRTGGVMLVITFIQVVFAIAAVYYGARVAMAFGRDVRAALFHRVTNFSAQDVSAFGAPSLITRITNDVTQVQILVLMSCTLLVAAPITIIGGTIMAIREDGPLALLLLVSIPALVISVGLVIIRMVPQFQVMQVRIDRINEILREQITGLRVVRAFVREGHEKRRFSVANDDLTLTSLRAGRLMAFMFPTVVLILNTSSVAAIWLGANRIGNGEMQVGALIAFLSYLIQILMSVMMATFVAVMAPRASVSSVRIKEILDATSSVVAPAHPVTTLDPTSSLELRNVEFKYPGADFPVLCDISFRATAGETVAIIGSTGSGKTTLLNLVPRLFDATGGDVFVDGVNVREIEPELPRCMQERGTDVVAIPRPDNLAPGNRAAMFLIGHHVGHDLAGMGAVGQAVDHRDRGVLGHLQQRRFLEGADHDQIDIARQHLGGVGDGLAMAKLHFLAGQHHGLAAQLAHADVKGHAGAGRWLFEDQRHHAARQRLVVVARALGAVLTRGFHRAGRGDHGAQVGGVGFVDVEEVFHGLVVLQVSNSIATV